MTSAEGRGAMPSATAEGTIRDIFLNHRVHIGLKPQERRAFFGKLVCTDHLGNVVLHEGVEQRLAALNSEAPNTMLSERRVPLIMIPGTWIETVSTFSEELPSDGGTMYI